MHLFRVPADSSNILYKVPAKRSQAANSPAERTQSEKAKAYAGATSLFPHWTRRKAIQQISSYHSVL